MATRASRKPAKTTVDDVKDVAHNVWLAGLGAFAAAGSESEKLFKTLVSRGKQVEKDMGKPVGKAGARLQSTVKQARQRAGKSLGGIQATIDRSVSSALQGIGVPTRNEIAALTRRVEKLTRTLEGNGTRKAARKKVKKKTAKRSTR